MFADDPLRTEERNGAGGCSARYNLEIISSRLPRIRIGDTPLGALLSAWCNAKATLEDA